MDPTVINVRYIIAVGISIAAIFFVFLSSQSTIEIQAETIIQNQTEFQHPLPTLKDPNLKVEIVADGLYAPTGMLFLDNDNILVLKRYAKGFPLGGLTTVNLVSNGTFVDEPVLTVPSGRCDSQNPEPGCSKNNERGLLGITARKINPSNASVAGNLEVFLYYTEITQNGDALGNRVYKYLWDGRNLVKPVLILSLPALPGPNHNAGKVLIGPDGYLYTIIGDQTIGKKTIPIHQIPSKIENILIQEGGHRGQVQNIINGTRPDNTSGIFRVIPDNGLPAPGNPFMGFNDSGNDENTSSLSRYFAYGIRNSFGLAFDPVSGNLWDTENGVGDYDEINLVKPGFNSGWAKIMGPMDRVNATKVDFKAYGNNTWHRLNLTNSFDVTENDLVNFPRSKYSDPEFSWNQTIGVTALGFLNSSKLGEKYKNNLFVGDYLYGNLYFFKINKNRDGIEFDKDQKQLSDLVADNPKERSQIVLGTGFDIITDVQTGPDGYLYILSHTKYSRNHPDNVSRIYRIVPAT